MKYSIITPTYNRSDLLKRSLDSVINQTPLKSGSDWEMVIVNDSPTFDYSWVETYLENIKSTNPNLKNKIKYFENKENLGNNFCKNFALENLNKDSDYIIFLDDDDYLTKEALKEIDDAILESKDYKKEISWLVTNRIKDTGESLTRFKPLHFVAPLKGVNTEKNFFSYFLDYLILKNITGDATHIIKSDLAKKIRFSENIKNGEEWLYFIQIPSPIIYKNLNTTITNGYLAGGLTDELKNKYKENTKILWREIFKDKKLFLNFKILVYMILRSIKSLIK